MSSFIKAVYLLECLDLVSHRRCFENLFSCLFYLENCLSIKPQAKWLVCLSINFSKMASQHYSPADQGRPHCRTARVAA